MIIFLIKISVMVSLRCTLCCGETFGTPEELRSHLKRVLENIFCSRCRLRFCSLEKLLEHYNIQDCQVKKPCSESILPGNDSLDLILPDALPTTLMDEKGNQDVSPDETKTLIQQSLAEIIEPNTAHLTDMASDINTEANVAVPIDTENNCGGENSVSEEENMFQCSCGMSFSSIVDHLMIYHCDEEVLVKGSSLQLETLLNTVSSQDAAVEEVSSDKISQDPPSDEPEIIEERAPSPDTEEPEVILCDRDSQSDEVEAVKSLSTPTLTSVEIDQLEGKVEECVDKDGRLYLRKFVRVEKFWSEKDEIKAAQMLSKVKNFEPVRDVPVGSVSIKSKDEAVSDKLSGSPKKLYQCSKCRKTFQTMIHFRYHVCTLKNGPSTTCNLCGHESTSSKELRAHWRMHQRQRRVAATALWELQASEGISANGNIQDEEMIELQCERCGEMYKKCDELVHIAMHDEEPPYECKKCNETFDSKDRLTRHMRSHREQKTHICLYCGKSFTDSNAFKLHVRSHTGEKPFECTYCGKTFSRPYERMKHERIHTGERPHVCEICGKTFRVSYCLTLHKRTHSGDRPYCCDICGKRFKAHSAYKHHVQIHSEARNYKCPFCPKAFKTMVHLAGHKKTHTKPFSCTECNRRFASLYSVKAHMESHKTGDNRFRYRCFVCGASYARAFALQYHMQTHGPCDAPEDVAEVLEICEEEDKKDGMSDIDDAYLDKKTGDDNQIDCDVTLKLEDSSD